MEILLIAAKCMSHVVPYEQQFQVVLFVADHKRLVLGVLTLALAVLVACICAPATVRRTAARSTTVTLPSGTRVTIRHGIN